MSGGFAKFSRMRLPLLAATAALAASGAAAWAAKVEPAAGVLKVRLGGDAAQTRLVIELDHAVTGKLVDAEGDGVTLALSQATVPGDMQGSGAGLIRSWKVEGA